MEDLYRNIKEFRIMRGMSQEELAELTDYTSRTSIAKIEAGKVNLPVDKIVKFANALNVTYSELMGYTYDENGTPTYARNCRTAEEMTSLIGRFDYTPEELKKIIGAAVAKLTRMALKNTIANTAENEESEQETGDGQD